MGEKSAAPDQLKSSWTRRMNFTNHVKAGGWARLAWASLESWADSCELVVVAWADWTLAHLWLQLWSWLDWLGGAASTHWAPTAAVTGPQEGELSPCFNICNRKRIIKIQKDPLSSHHSFRSFPKGWTAVTLPNFQLFNLLCRIDHTTLLVKTWN